MKFTKDEDASGTSLQGYVTAYYHQLVERFGEPNFYNGDKTTVEWCLKFEDGTVATIYDWKEYETPMGKYQWHIGGKSKEAVWAVMDAMKETV
jgi:hypothetical protein